MVYLENFLIRRASGAPTGTIIKNKDRRQHVINQVMNRLDDWRRSPWEREGAVRAGLRAGFYELGHGWTTADDEVAALIGAALDELGVTDRPSWAEGQRDYAPGPDYCRRCSSPMSEEQIAQGNQYCGSVCARADLADRDFRDGWWNHAVGRRAYDMIRKSRTKPRTCLQCGTEFRVASEAKENRFCSKPCRNESMKTRQLRACEFCSTPFLPSLSINRFCSIRCSNAVGKTRKYRQECEVCSSPFQAANPHAMYCSGKCNAKAHYYRKKAAVAKTKRRRSVGLVITLRPLTTRTFDSLFRRKAA